MFSKLFLGQHGFRWFYASHMGISGKVLLWDFLSSNKFDPSVSTKNKLAPYGSDGRLFATDVCANFKVT